MLRKNLKIPVPFHPVKILRFNWHMNGLEWEPGFMFINHVQIHVKPELVEAFKEATLANARESRKEPGIARFECLQQLDDPTRFLLIEAFRNDDAQGQHRETKHYQMWRDAVASMMAEARVSAKFAPLDAGD